MISFTFGVNVQRRSKTKWTNGDVSWDSQRAGCEEFERFLRLFADHQFIQMGRWEDSRNKPAGEHEAVDTRPRVQTGIAAK